MPGLSAPLSTSSCTVHPKCPPPLVALHPLSTDCQVVTLSSVPHQCHLRSYKTAQMWWPRHKTVQNVHKCGRCENGHLVNSHPSSPPHLTIMSFSVKIPDKLISRGTIRGNPARPAGIPLLARRQMTSLLTSNPTLLASAQSDLNSAHSQLAFWISPSFLHQDLAVASIRPSRLLLWNILQTKQILTPIRVSLLLLGPIPAAGSRFLI